MLYNLFKNVSAIGMNKTNFHVLKFNHFILLLKHLNLKYDLNFKLILYEKLISIFRYFYFTGNITI